MDILALDLGKYKTVFCKYDSMTGEHEFGKIKTTCGSRKLRPAYLLKAYES